MRLAVPDGLERGGEAPEAGELLLQVLPVDDLGIADALDLAGRQDHPAVLLLRRGRGRGRLRGGGRRARILHRGVSCPRVGVRAEERAQHGRAVGARGVVIGVGGRRRPSSSGGGSRRCFAGVLLLRRLLFCFWKKKKKVSSLVWGGDLGSNLI